VGYTVRISTRLILTNKGTNKMLPTKEATFSELNSFGKLRVEIKNFNWDPEYKIIDFVEFLLKIAFTEVEFLTVGTKKELIELAGECFYDELAILSLASNLIVAASGPNEYDEKLINKISEKLSNLK